MAAMADVASTVSSGLEEEISLARFGQHVLILLSERDMQQKHLLELGRRLQEAEQERTAARNAAETIDVELREALRKQSEAEKQATLHQRSLEDERKRQELALRLATEKTSESQRLACQQGQRIHSLEEQLRAQENEVSRLKIEKDGTSGLISSFQQRLEEVGKIVDAASRSEQLCKAALRNVKADQTALAQRLTTCQAFQRSLASIKMLEAELQTARHHVSERDSRIRNMEEALKAKERDVLALRQQCTSWQEELGEAGRQAEKQHAAALKAEARTSKLVDTLQKVRQVTV